MRQNISKVPLIIAIAIPLIMVLLVAATIFLPSLYSARPQYNFLYTVNDQGYTYPIARTKSYYVYEVKDSKLIRQEITPPNPKAPLTTYLPPPDRGQKLYIYDVKRDISSLITFEEARKLKLDDNNASPDGFVIQRGGQRENIFSLLFDASDYHAVYLVKDGSGKKITIGQQNARLFTTYDFNFLGWVVP